MTSSPRLHAALAVVCLALTATALAQSPRFTTAPLRVSEQPSVQIFINGKATPCMVDTGSNLPLVLFNSSFPELARQQNTRGEAPVEVRITANGPACASSARMLEATQPGIKGIIGWPLLKNSIWQLDLPNQRHQFFPELPAEVKSQASFAIVKKRASLAVTHPQLGETFLDSGAMRGVCLSPERWRQWRANAGQANITLTSGFSPAAENGVFACEVAHHVNFALAPLTLRDTNVGTTFFNSATASDNASLLIGLESLNRTVMTIDGPGGRVYFREAKAGAWKPTPPNRLQAAFLPAGRAATLRIQVIPGGSAARQGLRDGDQLLALNDEIGAPKFDRMQAFARKSGTTATFTVLRGDRSLRLPITVP